MKTSLILNRKRLLCSITRRYKFAPKWKVCRFIESYDSINNNKESQNNFIVNEQTHKEEKQKFLNNDYKEFDPNASKMKYKTLKNKKEREEKIYRKIDPNQSLKFGLKSKQ